MKNVLFDSHAILKWTQMEPGFKKVKSLLESCRAGSLTGYMNQINLGEVYYKSIRVVGPEAAKKLLENYLRLPLVMVAPDSDLIWKASEIKASYPMSYADCFAVATAIRFEADVVTGDPEFKKAQKLVKIHWV